MNRYCYKINIFFEAVDDVEARRKISAMDIRVPADAEKKIQRLYDHKRPRTLRSTQEEEEALKLLEQGGI